MLGGFDGGYYLVKRISNIFNGLRNIREPYSKWVIERIDKESREKEEDTDQNADSLITSFRTASERWDKMYDELRYFTEKNYKSKNISLDSYSPSLSKWVRDQRIRYKQGRLSEEQIYKLDKIKAFVWNHLDKNRH